MSGLKSRIPMGCAALAAALAFFAAGRSVVSGQQIPQGVSRPMEQAIRLYHQGQDNEAMDRFMDILMRGTPSEKALANEYINKITLRLNTRGVSSLDDKGPQDSALNTVKPVRVSRPAAPSVVDEPGSAPASSASLPASPASRSLPPEDAESRRALIAEKINEKIGEMRRQLLISLGRTKGVKVYSGADGQPKAVTLDTAVFFSGGTVFTSATMAPLSDLAALLFASGKTNCLIIPEGSVGGDIQILSIRRAIALNSFFVSRGLSPARLDVNLTGADVKFPRELTNVSGMVLLFNPDVQPRLKDPDADARSGGPKISLGLYPTSIDVQTGEGALVELSVFESGAGTPTWKFQIYQMLKDDSLLLVQEVAGEGPQFNQSFWNGRKNFFGESYPSGRYLFSLTAYDLRGKESSLRRLLIIKPTAAEQAAAAAPAVSKGRPLSKSAAPAKRPAPGKKRIPSKTRAGKTAAAAPAAADPAEAEPAPAGGEEASEFIGQVIYKIYFRQGTSSITTNSEKKLAQVANTTRHYPDSRLKITGYASPDDQGGEELAQTRADLVFKTLVSAKYKVPADRIDVAHRVSRASSNIVEIRMGGGE
ncbi:MAG: OmpA family protein [Elusimicrobiales bacterium]|nr:OmpA family protein [Elusimicrobiales bacterium]